LDRAHGSRDLGQRLLAAFNLLPIRRLTAAA